MQPFAPHAERGTAKAIESRRVSGDPRSVNLIIRPHGSSISEARQVFLSNGFYRCHELLSGRGLSDEEIEHRALTDPDGQALCEADLENLAPSSRVRILRMALGMTQEEFAKRFELSLATVRDWEQGRSEPHQASMTLLKVIARIPEAVEKALVEEG